jgi:UDP-N-acetylglucosamine--N-acetylmuramyl-(pentapeptide) pyrophosphoryl-undecaprenol N-acetylglucosamine transferase
MLRERPRATLATGGYVSVPAAVASWLCRVPLVLFLPDVVPGVAVRRLVPIARCIAVTSEDSLRYLPRDKTVVTGYPVRESFLRATRESGRQLLGIPAEATVLCVFGGSLGAQSINRAVARYLPDLLRRHYVLHICGWQRLEEAQAAAVGLTELQRARYRLYPFLDEEHMAAAMASADLALCRSGASTLGELPAVGTPAVLVPLPQREVHQLENASYLADRGAAVVLANDELHDRLGEVLLSLLDDPDRLLRMAEACASLARPQAADDVAALLLELAA